MDVELALPHRSRGKFPVYYPWGPPPAPVRWIMRDGVFLVKHFDLSKLAPPPADPVGKQRPFDQSWKTSVPKKVVRHADE